MNAGMWILVGIAVVRIVWGFTKQWRKDHPHG
jgi:hypothetical protein